MKTISTKNAPGAIGPYSQGMMENGTLYVSGQTPLIPKTMVLVSQDIKEQTKQCLVNILAIVEQAGFKKENIIKCGVFMLDLGQFKEMNEVYAEFFGDHKPTRFAVEVRRLPMDASVEIDAIVVE